MYLLFRNPMKYVVIDLHFYRQPHFDLLGSDEMISAVIMVTYGISTDVQTPCANTPV